MKSQEIRDFEEWLKHVRRKEAMKGEYWLSCYYPPNIDDFKTIEVWRFEDSTGPYAEPDWIYFPDGYYTEAEIRMHIDFIKLAKLQGVSDGTWMDVKP